ncbi:MAG TPA: phosphorylase [Terriglobales bacterium]
MQHKPVAVIAAMRAELAPLIGKIRPKQVSGVVLYDLPGAVVVIGGIGEKFAHRAAEVAVEYAQPTQLISAGIAGAVSPKLKVGDVGRIREVVHAASGTCYSGTGADWILVTSQCVTDATIKQELLTRYAADVVDMEAAAVAQVAHARGLKFAAVKAISDEATFLMPPLGRFIDENGRFATGSFLMYVAARPRWWSSLGTLKRNNELAAANLCRELEHLLKDRG